MPLVSTDIMTLHGLTSAGTLHQLLLQVIARETARQLGMGTNILGCDGLPSLGPNGEIPPNLGETLGPKAMGCNGFAQVFPEHKFLIVEALRQKGFKVGMTGDGVNDAPGELKSL